MDIELLNEIEEFLVSLANERLSKRSDQQRRKILNSLESKKCQYLSEYDTSMIPDAQIYEGLDEEIDQDAPDSDDYVDIMNSSVKAGPLFLNAGFLTTRKVFAVVSKFRLYLFKYKGENNEKIPEYVIDLCDTEIKLDNKRGKKFSLITGPNKKSSFEFKGMDDKDVAMWTSFLRKMVATAKSSSSYKQDESEDSDPPDDYDEFASKPVKDQTLKPIIPRPPAKKMSREDANFKLLNYDEDEELPIQKAKAKKVDGLTTIEYKDDYEDQIREVRYSDDEQVYSASENDEAKDEESEESNSDYDDDIRDEEAEAEDSAWMDNPAIADAPIYSNIGYEEEEEEEEAHSPPPPVLGPKLPQVKKLKNPQHEQNIYANDVTKPVNITAKHKPMVMAKKPSLPATQKPTPKPAQKSQQPNSIQDELKSLRRTPQVGRDQSPKSSSVKQPVEDFGNELQRKLMLRKAREQ